MSSRRTMAELVEEYVADRRSMGFALRIDAKQLRDFARYAGSIGHCGPLTIDLATRWAVLPGRRQRQFPGRRLEVIRPFACYCASLDEVSEVPSRWLLGPTRRRPLHHIYTDEQIASLLSEAQTLTPSGTLRPETYTTLWGLLSSCGLRVSEALHLARHHVDLSRGVLVIEDTKFRKSRLVAMHSSTVDALRAYAERRDHLMRRTAAATFFVGNNGRPLAYSTVNTVFINLRNSLGWGSLDPRPRIHDLRHTFAVRCIREWYADGVDAGPRLAYLATYLGHAHITDTYWYLTGSPDLLALAANRFENLVNFSRPRGDS